MSIHAIAYDSHKLSEASVNENEVYSLFKEPSKFVVFEVVLFTFMANYYHKDRPPSLVTIEEGKGHQH